MEDIVILSGARTAIGTFGGSLAGVPPIDLGASVSKAALERAGVEGGQIGHVVFGHIINTEPRDMYLSRVVSGMPAFIAATRERYISALWFGASDDHFWRAIIDAW